MEKIILSLKNIYKLLMTNDFPVYSESVIGKTERKGLTALGFWQRILVGEFRNGTYGKMVWRNDGKRSRYTSHLCNRSSELKCYMQYAGELAVQINRDSVLKQIVRFEEFLKEKGYRDDVFFYRVKEFLRICKTYDSCLNDKILNLMIRSLEDTGFSENYEEQEKVFHAAYLMGIMTIYAAAGNGMEHPALEILQTKDYSVKSLWMAYSQKHTSVDTEYAVLTAHVSFLEDNALPPWRFFGREEELYDLKEVIITGQKRMITGMGGVGKTELIRQLLRWSKERQAVDRAAVIPCENSLAESIVRSFPKQVWEQEQDLQQRYENLIKYLEWEAKKRKLLIAIDNYSSEGENEKWLNALLQIPCSILVTTRERRNENISCYHLQMPNVSTGTLIFRDNYEKPLQQQDRDVLLQLMEEEKLCHPLTLRLIARAARSRNWSVTELRKQLIDKGDMLAWKEADNMVRMENIYRQLYSVLKIPEDSRKLAELFALLPRESYSTAFLKEWFPKTAGDKSESLFEELVEGGWLDKDDVGYSMHPLIAQCLRKKNLTEITIEEYLTVIRNRILQTEMNPMCYPEMLQKACRILIHMSSGITGNVSLELALSVLMAIELMGIVRLKEKEQLMLLVNRLLKNCTVDNEMLQICSGMILCRDKNTDPEKIMEIYCGQKKERTVTDWAFLPFCIRAGQFLSEAEPKYAREMWETVIEGNCSISWKVEACYRLAGFCNQSGDSMAALKWAERGRELFCGQECTLEWRITILSELCNLYTLLGQKKPAEQMLGEILKLFKETLPDDVVCGMTSADLSDCLSLRKWNDRIPDYITANVLSSSAVYELYYGNPETALQNYRELLLIMEMYNGKDQNHYLILGQTAIILQRIQKYEEALEVYQEILGYARECRDEYLTGLFCNNAAVTLLEMNRPEQALSYLEEAVGLTEAKGGIQLAEPLRNQARAYRAVGDTERELNCLKRAVPLLEECYGTEHPRAQESAERLEELINSREE